MYLNYDHYQVAQARYQDLLREAERERLIRSIRRRQPVHHLVTLWNAFQSWRQKSSLGTFLKNEQKSAKA
jgi:hypothetical protein